MMTETDRGGKGTNTNVQIITNASNLCLQDVCSGVASSVAAGSSPTGSLSSAAGGSGGFPVFGGGYPSSMPQMEEGFDQEEGKVEVTCM